MTVRTNTTLANQRLDSFDADFNNGALEFYSGAQPASADNAATGTLLAAVDPLPADAFNAAASRQKAKAGTWEDLAANAAGTIGWARLRNAGDTKRIDFSVTATGGGGDITVDNTVVAVGKKVTITGFTLQE
jgi:hypothetical protein